MTLTEINRTTYGAVVGRILAELREARGLEQSDLARTLGTSQSSWSRIERGDTALTTETLVRAAAALGVPPQEIVDRSERARAGLERIGVEVLLQRPKPSEMALALLGGAALGFLILKVLSK